MDKANKIVDYWKSVLGLQNVSVEKRLMSSLRMGGDGAERELVKLMIQDKIEEMKVRSVEDLADELADSFIKVKDEVEFMKEAGLKVASDIFESGRETVFKLNEIMNKDKNRFGGR